MPAAGGGGGATGGGSTVRSLVMVRGPASIHAVSPLKETVAPYTRRPTASARLWRAWTVEVGEPSTLGSARCPTDSTRPAS
ncbi:hypothetical protein ACKKBF_B15245 [Auxenochlorella protothecoides x Auxenochlorella symbiontica]